MALEYFFKALKLNEEIGNKRSQAINFQNIGIVYAELNDFTKALEYYFKAKKINEEIGEKQNQIIILENIGNVYYNLGEYSKALDYYYKSLEISEEIGDKISQATNFIYIGRIYEAHGDNKEAIKNYFKALKINEKAEFKEGQAIAFGNIGSIYIKEKKFKEAEKYLKKAIAISESLKLTNYLKDFYNSLFQLYLTLERYKEALEAYKKHVMYKDSIYKEENIKALVQKEMLYEFEKQQAIAKAEQEKKETIFAEEQKKERILRYSITSVLILVVLFLTIVYRSLQITKNQKKIIEIQKKDIMDSINYAKKIQEAVLPITEEARAILGDHFILYMPRDIVSGDFYYAAEVNNWLIVAVADCTGHGVPGAFMSMLGISFLTEIIRKKEITKANQALNELRKEIINALQQKGIPGEQKDGMDIGLIAINKENLICQFAGANNNMYLIKKINDFKNNNCYQLFEYKGDKMPIAIYDRMDNFTNYEIQLKKGDIIYLFTDGYVDQFGGENGKKFMTKRFKELILNNVHKPMKEQKLILEETILKWKGNLEQTDDITVLGMKI